MFKIVKVWVSGMVILMSCISMSFAYTDEELKVLTEDCETSLALQRQFQGNKVLMYRDIQLRTGDNCAVIVRQFLLRVKGVEFIRLYDKVKACAYLGQDLINENGGRRALPLPTHLQQQYSDHKIDGKSCLELSNEMKQF